jgi:hypothetical protein
VARAQAATAAADDARPAAAAFPELSRRARRALQLYDGAEGDGAAMAVAQPHRSRKQQPLSQCD